MYLVDTNVISEARKGRRANQGVIQFFLSTPANERYVAVQTIGETRRGVKNIRRRGDQVQALQLDAWLDAILSCDYLQGSIQAPRM